MTPQQVDALEHFLFFLVALITISPCMVLRRKTRPPPLGLGTNLARARIFRAAGAENSARSI